MESSYDECSWVWEQERNNPPYHLGKWNSLARLHNSLIQNFIMKLCLWSKPEWAHGLIFAIRVYSGSNQTEASETHYPSLFSWSGLLHLLLGGQRDSVRKKGTSLDPHWAWSCFWLALRDSLGTPRPGQGLCSKVVFNLMILVLGATKGNIKEEKVLPAVVQDVTCFCFWNFLVCLFQTQKIKMQSSRHPPPHPCQNIHFIPSYLFLGTELHWRWESTFFLPNHLFSHLASRPGDGHFLTTWSVKNRHLETSRSLAVEIATAVFYLIHPQGMKHSHLLLTKCLCSPKIHPLKL